MCKLTAMLSPPAFASVCGSDPQIPFIASIAPAVLLLRGVRYVAPYPITGVDPQRRTITQYGLCIFPDSL
jgi:hypothetical protein